MWVVNNRKIFYAVSIILVVLSLAAFAVWGLKPSIDFTGGTLVRVLYPEGRPSQEIVYNSVSSLDQSASIRPFETATTQGYIVRMKPLTQEEQSTISTLLTTNTKGQIESLDAIGPILGQEALRKAIVSVFLVILGIVLYITFAFRKVSEPVSSWKYGLIAIVALLHDVIIPIGAFAVLGQFAGYEVDTLFVTALLVVLGFSVHDTIVVFDRVRENLRNYSSKKPFAETVGNSVSQTFTRSINTSLTTLMALVILYLFGGQSTEHFSLALIIGIAAGTYSSIFVGSPLLVTVEAFQKKFRK